ncbi:MAG: PAS domain-containing protein [Alphaproteobacteria bacterium]|nr:PAS domain-containing protein [Alphaproteobacteria bacterium]
MNTFAKRVLKNAPSVVEALIDDSHDAIVILDPDRRVIRANGAFASLCGRQAPVIDGLQFSEAFQGKGAQQLSGAFEKAAESQEAVSDFVLCTHGHGFELELEATVRPIYRDGHLELLVGRLRPAYRDTVSGALKDA